MSLFQHSLCGDEDSCFAGGVIQTALHPDRVGFAEGSVGGKLAHEDIADYRMDHSAVSPIKPLLLGVCTAVPLWILWVILKVMQDSSAALNLFLLLNAPYIQYHRLILDGAEPFSAVSAGKQLLMALPPVLTAGAVFTGYQLRYLPEKAALDAQNMH